MSIEYCHPIPSPEILAAKNDLKLLDLYEHHRLRRLVEAFDRQKRKQQQEAERASRRARAAREAQHRAFTGHAFTWTTYA